MFKYLFTALLCLCAACGKQNVSELPLGERINEHHIVGYIENVQILPSGTILKGKLDTGALTSSLSILNSREYMLDGERWVEFTYRARDGESITLKRPIVYIASIKTHEGPPLRRPVVRMLIRIGDKEIETDVNLTSRANYTYALLLGRKFLEDANLAVSSKMYLSCKSSYYRKHPSLHLGKDTVILNRITDSVMANIEQKEE